MGWGSHAGLLGGVFKSQFVKGKWFLKVNYWKKTAPRTNQWLQERTWNTLPKSLAWTPLGGRVLFEATRPTTRYNVVRRSPHCTATQNISPKSTAPESQSLKSIGWSGTTLHGNLLPRTSQLTSGKTSWLAVQSLTGPPPPALLWTALLPRLGLRA